MVNNDVIRSIRYTLDLSDKRVVELMLVGGQQLSRETLAQYFLPESDDQAILCPDVTLAAFLNGLISDRRGARDPQPPPESRLDNNLMLKKLRIAFALRDNEIHKIVQSVGSSLTLTEVNAVFQKPGHKNFKSCGDQLLRQFLSGLAKKHRPPDNPLYKR